MTGNRSIKRNQSQVHNDIKQLIIRQVILLMLLSVSFASTSEAEIDGGQLLKDRPVTHTYTLADFGYTDNMRLLGIYSTRKLNFGIRLDETVVAMQVKLDYAISPALLSTLSHINIKINGFPVRSLTVGDELTLKHHDRITVKISPYMLKEYNQLTFEFIGHYTDKCEDPDHTSLWAVIGKKTEITIKALKLQSNNNLAQLPYPFFDKHDESKLNIPFVFAGQPTTGSLKAAGILASWFGAMADYRETKFPVLSALAPMSGNAIVFIRGKDKMLNVDISNLKASASTSERSYVIDKSNKSLTANHPDPNNPYALTGPTIEMIRNPNDAYGMLLVVAGRDDDEMIRAVQALTLGHMGLSGRRAEVQALDAPLLRKPYDAPRWLPDNRPVRFAELSGNDELQVQGVYPGPIRVNFRMPPDLFRWHGYEPRLKMKYHYSIPQDAQQARLNTSFNGQFLESFPLIQDGDKNGRYWMLAGRSLLTGDSSIYERLDIPTSSFLFRNQLKFYFLDLRMKRGECKQIPTDYFEGVIDPESTIDISHTPHFTRMPNIGLFLNGGFPFTRMADLSETAVVLPNVPDTATVATFLQLMGSMGASTGFPAVHMDVTYAHDIDQYADKDLLVIGAIGKDPMLKDWSDLMPVTREGDYLMLKELNSLQFLGSLFTEDDRRQGGKMLLKSSTDVGLLTSFESPLKDGRTVVVVTSTKHELLPHLADQMTLLPAAHAAHGDTLFITGDDNVSALRLVNSYYVGELPFWARIKWFLGRSPLALAVLIIVAIGLLAMILVALFRAREKRRLRFES